MKITGIGVKEPAPRELPCDSRAIYLAILACSLFFAKVAPACTGIRLRAEDGTVVYARTLEFNVDPDSDVIVVPRGYARTGTTPDGENGLKWTSKYASLGANSLGLPLLVDGVNEKGLAAGLFYFPTTAGYMKYNAAEASRTIAPWELASWILENFATVEEVKQNIGRIAVAEVVFKKWGMVIPVHFVVHDASGKSIVIEYIEGKLHVYDNVLGVLTNSPSFDWHMTNLRHRRKSTRAPRVPPRFQSDIPRHPRVLALFREAGDSLHEHPTKSQRRERRVRAHDGVRYRYGFQRARGAARLCANGYHTGGREWAEMDLQVCVGRRQQRWRHAVFGRWR